MVSPKEVNKRFLMQVEYLGSEKPVNIMKPIVSICVTTYQHLNFIKECLHNVLAQKTSFPFEIIVGEDHSTDGTREICIEYAKEYPDKIRLFLRDRKITALYDDKGLFKKSLNGIFTWKASRGKYVTICEGDDYWTDPYKLQKQVDLLEAHPEYSMCFHPVKVTYEDKSKQDYIFPNSQTHPFIYQNPFTELKNLIPANYIQTNSVMYRWRFHKEKIEDVFPTNILPGDWFLHLLHAEKGEIGFIDEVMAVYRRHSGGVWWESDRNLDKLLLQHGLMHIGFYQAVEKRWPERITFQIKEIYTRFAADVVRVFLDTSNFEELNVLKQRFPDYYDRVMEYIFSIYNKLAGAFQAERNKNSILMKENINLKNQIDKQRRNFHHDIAVPEEKQRMSASQSKTASFSGILVSIIIPLFNEIEFTKNCLEALIENTPDDLYEMIIVDNGSTDGTKDFLSTLEGDVKIITNTNNLGFAKACNQGADAATGEYIVFLNNNTIPHKNWLTELVDVVDAWGDVGIVGSKLLYPDSRIRHAGIAMLPALSHMYTRRPADFIPANKPRYLNGVTGACMLIRKDLFFSVGCFREGYNNGCEDIDLCLSVRAAGKKIFYNPRSVLTHFESKTPEREDRMDDNRKLLFKRWKDKMPLDYENYFVNDGFRKSPEDSSNWEYHQELCKRTISIVIVTYNSLSDIGQCLSSIQEQTNLPHEIIIVDNNSNDGTREFLKKLNGCTVILNNENMGFSKASNQGMKKASGEYIVLLNPDTIVTADWAWRMMLHFKKGVGAVGPISNYVAGLQKVELYCREDVSTKLAIEGLAQKCLEWNKGKSADSKLLIGFCLMIPHLVIEQIGMLDEDLFLGSDDLEYSHRLRANGYKLIVATDTFIYHKGQASFKTEPSAKMKRLTQDSQDTLFSKLKKYYGAGKVPSSQELWGMNWFKPTNRTPNLTSIIILTYNQLDYTKKCLESILANTAEPHEIIIVDNGSTDGTVEYLDSEIIGQKTDARAQKSEVGGQRTEVRVIKNGENLGFALGNDKGIAEAKGDYIVLMNNDVVVTPGWLKRLVEVAQKKPQIGIVGPMSNYVSGPQLVREVSYEKTSLKGLKKFSQAFAKKHKGEVMPYWRVVGFCMLIKREVIDKIGGLDGRFGLGNFEDDDFSLRAALAGFESWIVKDCFVHHFGSRTFAGAKIDFRESLHKNWEIFKEKWGIPSDVAYGASYDMAAVVRNGFIPGKHYCPLTIGEYAPPNVNNEQEDTDAAKKMYENAQMLVEKGMDNAAIMALVKLLESYPDFALAQNDLGVLYYKAGKKEDAFEHYKKAAKLQPENINFQKNLADFYYVELGKVQEAMEIYVKILSLNPRDIECLLMLGHISVSIEKIEDAKVFYSKVLEVDPNNADARRNLDSIQTYEQGTAV